MSLPEISWCSNCVYPSSSAIPLTFDADGVCSGCRVHRQKKSLDWDSRKKALLREVEPYRGVAGYDCVIGVSGGKDSYFQTHYVINELGLRPLLVTYNGNNYMEDGWHNLLRMKEVFNVDHLIISPAVGMLKKMNRLGFTKTGDMNWHAHCGILTVPMRIAAQFGISLVFWGEHGWTELGGMLSMNDFPEYTLRYRVDQGLRGYDWYDFVGDETEPITQKELEIYKYPTDEEIMNVDLRGLFLGNYDEWDAYKHTELVKKLYGWKESTAPFERTYRRISNLDDKYENGVHDYLKYIKFGYGRATDHACKDIRNGYMTREEAIGMVRKYDHIKPSDLYEWLDYVERDENWFWRVANNFRSPKVWKEIDGKWKKQNLWSDQDT